VPRAGLSRAAVTQAALELIDEHGSDELTLAKVAEHTGVAAPSLYKHVRSLADLRTRVAICVVGELTERLSAAVMGRGGDQALRAAMLAYRQYVLEHPNRYAAFPQAPPSGIEQPELAAAVGRLLEVVLAVLRGYGLEGSAAIHAARCFRATVHGFASLQAAGAFRLPEDLDTTYDQLIGMLTTGIGQIEASQ
jgi:AcrR family transcriptional regulator